MKQFLFAAAIGLTALAATPAAAQAYQGPPPPSNGYYEESDLTPATQGDQDDGYYEDGYDQGGYDQRGYDQRECQCNLLHWVLPFFALTEML